MKYMLYTFIPNTIVAKISLLCLLKIFLKIPLVGQSIQFSLHDGSKLIDAGSAFDNENSIASLTKDGITLSLEALIDENSANAVLNGGAEGFGVNSNSSVIIRSELIILMAQNPLFFLSALMVFSMLSIYAILRNLQMKLFYLLKEANNSVSMQTQHLVEKMIFQSMKHLRQDKKFHSI